MMSLRILGLITWSEATTTEILDRRTKAGKLWHHFSQYNSLFLDGTCLSELQEMVSAYSRRTVKLAPITGTGAEIRRSILNHLKLDHPVILGLGGQLGHWTVVIGWEAGDEDDNPARFLTLDPSDEPSLIAPWNNILDLFPHKGRHPYTYMSARDVHFVTLDHALAVCSEQHHPHSYQSCHDLMTV